MNSYTNMLKKFKNSKDFSTNKLAKDYFPLILQEIKENTLKNPNQIFNYWYEIVGQKLAPLTKITAYKNKNLYIQVKSSTLYSILKLHEKNRLLKLMQDKFSKDVIKNIYFKIG